MVLRPSRPDLRRMRNLLASPHAPRRGYEDYVLQTMDGGDQTLWHGLYSDVSELPTAYNALGNRNLTAEEWGRVFVLHDVARLRVPRRWPGLPARLRYGVARLAKQTQDTVARMMAG